ncbi:MAG: 50S ribosomal protein L23 [Bordetella sp.]|nr:MAG: 50S ribosomal protein L23 [Bordetella sp.]
MKSTERLMQVILSPIFTEKASFISEKKGQVTFRVMQNATKPEIKAAIQLLFKVDVDSVQSLKSKGKIKRFGRFIGRRRNEKKVYVSLKDGQKIDFSEGV